MNKNLISSFFPVYFRQQSYDLVDEDPLPSGWQMMRTSTGQRYYLNHANHTTTWEDPRKKLNGKYNFQKNKYEITLTQR